MVITRLALDVRADHCSYLQLMLFSSFLSEKDSKDGRIPKITYLSLFKKGLATTQGCSIAWALIF